MNPGQPYFDDQPGISPGLLNNVDVVESAQTKVLSSQVRELKSIWK
jgi:hypothetical protein